MEKTVPTSVHVPFFFLVAMNCCFSPGAIFTLPCQPFHTELGHEGSEFRSGCGALMQLRTHLLMQSEETSEWLNPQDVPTWKRSQGWKLQNMHGKICPSRVCPLKKNYLILVQTPLLCLCCGNEMQGWSLADDNEVKETNNLSPVGFSNINN